MNNLFDYRRNSSNKKWETINLFQKSMIETLLEGIFVKSFRKIQKNPKKCIFPSFSQLIKQILLIKTGKNSKKKSFSQEVSLGTAPHF